MRTPTSHLPVAQSTHRWLLPFQEGLIEKLRGLVSDPNPMVVANAVAGLSYVHTCTCRAVSCSPALVLLHL